MPYYLVTQTSLIEANNAHEAAQKEIDQVRSGGQVTVAVKSDETTVSSIVVAARRNNEQSSIATAVAEPVGVTPQLVPDAMPIGWTVRKSMLKRMIGDALALLPWKR